MPDQADGPSEARLRSRFRVVTIAVILITVVVYIAGGIFELPFLRTTFQVEPTVLGALLGALLLLLGIEGIAQIPGIGKGPRE